MRYCTAVVLLFLSVEARRGEGTNFVSKRPKLTLFRTPRGGSSDVPPPPPPPPSSLFLDSDDPPYQPETVQERVNSWRQNQQEIYSHLSPEQEHSPRDLQGRLKLITTVSKGSRALIFFILMWRDVHLYEVADQTHKGIVRLLLVLPLMFLFLGNLAGVVASITSPSHSAKKRMKAILNLDKVIELFLVIYNFFRLTLFPSKYTPREVYIANTLHSVFFLIQCQAFTRLTWDEVISNNAVKIQQAYSYGAAREEESSAAGWGAAPRARGGTGGGDGAW